MLTATVNHNAGMVRWSRLLDRLGSCTNMLRCKIGALGATAQDDVDILVSTCLDDCGKTLLRNTHEGVGVRGRAHRVNSDRNTAKAISNFPQ